MFDIANPKKKKEEFIVKFNEKKEVFEAAFNNQSDFSVVPALVLLFQKLSELNIPLGIMGITTLGRFITVSKRIWKKLRYAKLEAKTIDVPLAVSCYVESVILKFVALLPAITNYFYSSMESMKSNMSELGIDNLQDFITDSFNTYLKALSRLKIYSQITENQMLELLESTIAQYIRNVPIIRGLMEKDNKLIYNMFYSTTSKLSIVSNLHSVWKMCCDHYGEGLRKYDDTIYFDFANPHRNIIKHDDAFCSFINEALFIITTRKIKVQEDDNVYEEYVEAPRILNPKVENIKSYLIMIVQTEIVDRISRNPSTMTAAVSDNVGNNTYKLEAIDEDEDKYTNKIPTKTANQYNEAMLNLAEVSPIQKEIVENIMDTGEKRPRMIAESLGVKESIITTEKSRALKKLREAYFSKEGDSLNRYYGVSNYRLLSIWKAQNRTVKKT